MITPGQKNILTVNRISDHGLYLGDEEENEVLLPNRYVSLENRIGDKMEVFIYHDSEDRLVATTEKPLAMVGQVALLKVVDKTVHGAFLDWGLTAKDIFLPNRNMVGRVEAGQRYVVYLYTDKITSRTVATMEMRGFISNEVVNLKRGQEVNVIVARETDAGFRVIIDNKYWGMLYSNQLYSPLRIGDRVTAYVRKITEDNRVDLSMQQEGFDEVKKSVDKLVSILRDNGGFLPLNDGSSPDQVTALTGMSKKVFKRSLGYMMKREMIAVGEDGITLKE